MIINERNLIIGKIFVIVSDYSITTFSYFENFCLDYISNNNKFLLIIKPDNKDPPQIP